MKTWSLHFWRNVSRKWHRESIFYGFLHIRYAVTEWDRLRRHPLNTVQRHYLFTDRREKPSSRIVGAVGAREALAFTRGVACQFRWLSMHRHTAAVWWLALLEDIAHVTSVPSTNRAVESRDSITLRTCDCCSCKLVERCRYFAGLSWSTCEHVTGHNNWQMCCC